MSDIDRWRRVERLCHEALDRPAADRAAFLKASGELDDALLVEVESLLAHESEAERFLEWPVGAAVAIGMRSSAPSLTGRKLGSFEVGAMLGAGGMGEVYRARDSKLHRDVALKILPAPFVDDADRLARFRREARVLAALNHPNIAAIYGLEEENGVLALALELVEGPTLADRLTQGPIPIEDARSIALQIADALEAAHERGIVHRDLKPANIKLRPDDTVKVLDFGLAKALDASPAGTDISNSPTITSPAMTRAGVILGTAAYMSPEQAKGREADRRSDVWAFGAVLYEMLSGARAFKGEDVADTLASVLRADPDWTALPPQTPPSVRRLLRRCLEKHPRSRLQHIGDARLELTDVDPTEAANPVLVAAPTRRRVWPLLLLAAAAAAGATAVVLAASWYAKPLPARAVTRFPFALADGQSITLPANRHMIALSPNGEQIVYVANARLHVRSLPELDAHAIQGTERTPAPTDPVFSPDGQSIAFYAPADQTIKRIAVTGGVAVTICQADIPYGMAWGEGGILFGQGRKGIMRVSPDGGTPEVLVRVEENEEAHGPQLLPDGQHILFTVASGIDLYRWDNAQVVVQSLASGERKTLITGTDARFATTGHLVYALGATLFAVPFDAGRLEVTGAPVPMIEGVRRSSNRETGAVHFSLSRTGSLIYLPARFTGPESGEQQIILTDRKGNVEALKLPAAQYRGGTRASPDGTRIAFAIDDGNDAIVYTYDLSGGSPMRRLTFGGRNRFPIWSADSKRVTFQSDREGDLALFWQAADGTGKAERLTTPGPGESHEPEAWSPDDGTLLFSITKGADVSLWTLPLQTRKAEPFGDVHSAYPTGARFSPDGRWIAYAQTGQGATRYAIYVQPFPATGATYQLFVKESSDRFNSPHKVAWSPDGKELLYVPRLGGFEAVTVTTHPTFAFGNAVDVPRPFQPGAPNSRTLFDITPAGKFVGLKSAPQLENGNFTAPTIQVVLNWTEELNARAPYR